MTPSREQLKAFIQVAEPFLDDLDYLLEIEATDEDLEDFIKSFIANVNLIEENKL